MALSRDDILSIQDLEVREVDVPEWGGSVFLKALSGKERDDYEASLRQERKDAKGRVEFVTQLGNVRAKLVARAIVDDAGQRVFTDQDINALGQKSAAVLDRLFEIVADMSGLSEESEEEISGNSEAGQTGSTHSDSAESSV